MEFNKFVKLVLEDCGEEESSYDKSKYPYGSKCPKCLEPTWGTERKTGPDATCWCKGVNKHFYKRHEAIPVE